MVDLSGKKFGRLTVIERSEINISKRILWSCRCACGNNVLVMGKLLRNGDTKSCGCLRKQLRTKHGHSKTGVYHTWQQMIQRCNNPRDKAYKDYGGRGIIVCDRWLKFDDFFEDVGEKPSNKTLDRIDNDKGYNKHNCQWSTPKLQAQNRRDTCLVTYDARTQCLSAWADEVGISRATLQYRINNGWPIKKAMEQLPRKYRKKM